MTLIGKRQTIDDDDDDDNNDDDDDSLFYNQQHLFQPKTRHSINLDSNCLPGQVCSLYLRVVASGCLFDSTFIKRGFCRWRMRRLLVSVNCATKQIPYV